MNSKSLKILVFIILSTAYSFAIETSENFSLEGTWQQDCANRKIKTQHFKNKNSTLVETFFSGSDCRQSIISFINHGTFEIENGKIDFIFSFVGVRLLNAEWVQRYNDQKVCGFDQWIINKTFDVSGNDCDFFLIGAVFSSPKKGEARYGTFRITMEQNQRTLLYLAQISPEKDGTTPEKRPTVLQKTPYVLQSTP